MNDSHESDAMDSFFAELAEKDEQIATLKAELKSLTEAYNNTDWKKLTDEQKEIINNLTVRWGKVLRENKRLYELLDNPLVKAVIGIEALRGGEVK